MSNRLNLARKYRPLSLEEVKGQTTAVHILEQAIKTNRIAPAYLFSGPRGTGKTTCARIFARAASCLNEDLKDRPCGKCKYCKAASEGKSMDIMEIDGASHTGVDDVRSIIESVAYRPSLGKRNVYIIDEVHMLSNAAFNALLKTLEEPPSHALFLFATTEPEKIPETILSRVQRIPLRRIKEKEIITNLQVISKTEKIKVGEEVLQQIAAASDGCLRDAQTLLEQVIILSGSKDVSPEVVDSFLGTIGLTKEIELLETISHQEITKLLQLVSHFYEQGKDLTRLLSRLIHWTRALLVSKSTGQTDLIKEDFDVTHIQRLLQAFKSWSLEDLDRLFENLWQGMERMKKSEMPKVTLETTLIRTSQITKTADLSKILDFIESNPRAQTRVAPPVPQRVAPSMPSAPKSPPKKEAAVQELPQDLHSAEDFKDIIRQKKASLHGLIVCANEILVTKSKVKLVFPKGHFAFKQISQKVLIEDIEALLKGAVGKKVSLVVEESSKETTPPPSSASMMKDVKKALTEDPAIKMAEELLGAKVESVTIEGVKN